VPIRIRFFYILEGFDKTWIPAGDNQTIVYSNLKPGNYELVLGIAGEDSKEPVRNVKTLSIRIKPPFWLNGWAYLVYTLFFLAGIYLLTRYLTARSRLRQQVKMRDFQQQKERELYQSKINFFTNVAHEIRYDHLTLIKAPLDHILMKKDVSESVKDNLLIMSKNTERLLNLTNQLLDFRKTESEAYLLNLQTQNVTELIRETILRFTPLAQQKNITFETDLPENDMYVQLDREAFIKVISNLLNNALKFCDRYVRLEANISDNEIGEFHLITINDGELIPAAYEKEIFKPFVQIDGGEEKNIPGTGIGLALASSLVELHGGSLKLENDDHYNRFHLKLPVGNVQHEETSITEQEQKRSGLRKERIIKERWLPSCWWMMMWSYFNLKRNSFRRIIIFLPQKMVFRHWNG